nr:trichohyalin-like [Anolis sagrei ordinatus]
MTNPKIKLDQRRGSLPGSLPENPTTQTPTPTNPTAKDILKEIQKIQEKLEASQEKQDAYQKIAEDQRMSLKKDLKEEITKLKNEITAELGEMKKEMDLMRQETKSNQAKIDKVERKQEELTKKVENIDLAEAKLEAKQTQLEQKELEYFLRFRSIQEDAKENLREVITTIVAAVLEISEDDAESNIDRTYRVSTNYAKRHKVDRDVVVQFGRKFVRDEVLRKSNQNPPYFKGKKITILKEHVQSVIQKRRKYLTLTEELRRRHIRYRWEKGEGLMATYKNEKIWITSEEKAHDFLKTLKKDNEDQDFQYVPGMKMQVKRTRTELPEKTDMATGFTPTALEKVPESQDNDGTNN